MGKTNRDNGSKLMAVADRSGLPVSVRVTSASQYGVRLVGAVLEARFVPDPPRRLIGDRVYDNDWLDWELAEQGIKMIAPHRRGRLLVCRSPRR